MHRGKIIGAIVLVVAIGLVVSQQLGEPDGGTADGGAPANAGSAAGQPAAGGAAADAGGAPARLAAALPAAGETRAYSIDPAASELYWRIYRAGTLARLGHNHIISVTELEGSVTLASSLDAAEWELSFPVNALVVDDPELRARYGEDFESTPSEGDKEGTKQNMLTDRLLNGEMFPRIRLEGQGIAGSLENASLPATISIVGQTIEQTFPATVSIAEGGITVEGEYRLTHEDLGLTPFTALGGAMAVGDEIDFTYRLRAVASGQ